MSKEITQELLHQLFIYNPESGEFKWKKRINPAIKLDKPVCTNSHGYYVVQLNKILHGVHRLIWVYMTGKFPEEGIDHKNRIKNDNRWSNLRAANKKDNVANSKLFKHNTSGYRGVSFDKSRNKWSVYLHMNGKRKYLGRFDDKEFAKQVYDKAAKEYFGEFYNG